MSKLLILGAAALVLAATTDAAVFRPQIMKDEAPRHSKHMKKSSFKHKPTNTHKYASTRPTATTLDEDEFAPISIGPNQSGPIMHIGSWEEDEFKPIQIGPHQDGNIFRLGPYEEQPTERRVHHSKTRLLKSKLQDMLTFDEDEGYWPEGQNPFEKPIRWTR